MEDRSVMVSRGSHREAPTTPHSVTAPPSQRRTGAAGLSISCNQCRKPLNTTVFVCACDCVFCEECTYNHFDSSSNCPICNRVLSENDFMELVVADPSAATTNSTKTSHFQTLFTKQNAANRVLPFQDLCARMLKQQDDCRAGIKFLMKQFLVEASKQGQRFQQVLRAFEGLKQEHTALKQSANSQKMRYEKAVETLQQQLASASKKLEEKDRQLHQFRKLHDRMTPESPGGGGGGGAGRNESSRRVSTDGSSSNSSSGNHHSRLVPQSGSRSNQQSQQAPPMKGFMIQKEAQERARQRALDASQHRSNPVLGHRGNRPNNPPRPSQHHHNPYDGNGGYATPRPRSSGSNGSGEIRDLTSSSGYAFSSGGRGGPPATNLHHQGGGGNYSNVNNNSSNIPKRRRAMSPSQAFASQPPGSYSVSRGPPEYFQQRR